MRKTLIKALLGILFIILISPACGQAQYLGTVSPATVQQVLAPVGTHCTGATELFYVQNLGQGNHYANATIDSATSFQMQILGFDISALGTYPISEQAKLAGASSGIVSGSGYFPTIGVAVLCLPVTATFRLDYSGGSSISQINSGNFLINQVEKDIFHAVDGTTSRTSILNPPPFGNSLGKIVFQYSNNSITGSTVTASCKDINLQTHATFTYQLQAVATVQTFPVPSAPCARIDIAYTFGAGGPGVIQELDYLFLTPAGNASPPTGDTLSSAINSFPILAEKGARWSVKHTPAVDVQATASKAAGAVGVRHVADCISYSLGAISAPTATVLTLNLRDGATGAGTIIWSKTLTAPATAALHADGNFCGLNLIGTAATAMTLEFDAGLVGEYESVSLTGYDVN